MKCTISARWCSKSWLSSKIRLLQLNCCVILGVQKQQRAHSFVSVYFKEAKARHYLAFMVYFSSPFSVCWKCDVTGISNHNPLTLRNFSHWHISSKLNGIIEGLQVVSSYQFNEKLEKRERSSPRFPIFFGFLFGWSCWLAGIRWMLPNQAKLILPPKQLIVMRCGRQFLRNERSKFLFKMGLPFSLLLQIYSSTFDGLKLLSRCAPS